MPKNVQESNSANIRLKDLRRSLKMSQTDFASKIGIKQGTLSDIERGRIAVSDNVAEKIEKEFGAAKEWLMSGKVDENIVEIVDNISFDDVLKSVQQNLNKVYSDPLYAEAHNVKIELLAKHASALKDAINHFEKFQSLTRQMLQYIHSIDKILFPESEMELYLEMKNEAKSKDDVMTAKANLNSLASANSIFKELNECFDKSIKRLMKFDAEETLSENAASRYNSALKSQDFHIVSQLEQIYNLHKKYPNL